MFFKDGKRSRDILKLEKANYEEIEDIDLDSMDLDHKEDLKDFAFYKEDYLEVKNKEDYGFDKDIYLLVNENVFSAAEGLASFAKNTGFAKLVGKRTGGDGITLGLINDFLPNSGLVFTYTNTLGYAPDGTINEEKKTDVDIKSQSYKKSIEIIKNLK
jgi:C-terminal processing protease CtpA/Prc